jgi:hypothetical protein
MTKSETLAALKNQLDSFYSLEQVIKIIEGIVMDPVPDASTEAIETAIDRIIDNLANSSNSSNDLVETESAEFSLNYDNTISLDRADLNLDAIRKEIGGAFDFLSNQ